MEAYLEGSISKEEITSVHKNLIDDFVNVCNFIRLYGLDYKEPKNSYSINDDHGALKVAEKNLTVNNQNMSFRV